MPAFYIKRRVSHRVTRKKHNPRMLINPSKIIFFSFETIHIKFRAMEPHIIGSVIFRKPSKISGSIGTFDHSKNRKIP